VQRLAFAAATAAAGAASAAAAGSAGAGASPTRGAATRPGRQPRARARGGEDEDDAREDAPAAKRPRGPGTVGSAAGGAPGARGSRRGGIIANHALAAKLGLNHDDVARALDVYSLSAAERLNIVVAGGDERVPLQSADLATLGGWLSNTLVTFVAQRLATRSAISRAPLRRCLRPRCMTSRAFVPPRPFSTRPCTRSTPRPPT
jgi:hypothetical protein